MGLLMLKLTITTLDDIKEALSNLKDTVYASESLHAENIICSEYLISLSGPDFSLGVVVGLDLIHSGVAEAWAITTKNIYKHPIAYTRVVKKLIEDFAEKLNLHRVQIRVKIEKELLGWADALGFYIEGIMVGYGKNKEDYYLMARYF